MYALHQTPGRNKQTRVYYHVPRDEERQAGLWDGILLPGCTTPYYVYIHVLPEAHTLPYPATAQHRPLGNDTSPIFACLPDFRGLNP